MKKWVYLDDSRIPKDQEFDLVTNYEEFVTYIENYYNENNEIPEVISFDHDLSIDHVNKFLDGTPLDYDNLQEKSGLCCAKWLTKFCEEKGLKLGRIFVHSYNPIGSENIISHINNYKIMTNCSPDCIKYNWKFSWRKVEY